MKTLDKRTARPEAPRGRGRPTRPGSELLDLLADALTERIGANLEHRSALVSKLRRARLKLQKAVAGNRA